MTFQSSFLIRCRLVAGADAGSAASYVIQHVQTSAEFRSASLDDLAPWIAAQNLQYLATLSETTPDESGK